MTKTNNHHANHANSHHANSHHANNERFFKSFKNGGKLCREGKACKFQKGLRSDWGTPVAAHCSGYGAVLGGKNHQANNAKYRNEFRKGVDDFNNGLKPKYKIGLKENWKTAKAANCSGYGSAKGRSEFIKVNISKGTVDGVKMQSEEEADVIRKISRKTGKVQNTVPESKKLFNYDKPVKGYHYIEVI